MKTKAAAAAVTTLLFLCLGLQGPALGAVLQGDVSDGLALVEGQIDDLLVRLGPNSEAFKAASGLSELLEALKDPGGAYGGTPLEQLAAMVGGLSAGSAGTDRQGSLEEAVYRLTVAVFQELLNREELDENNRQTVQNLLALIPGGMEAYEEPGDGPGFGHGQGGGPDDRDRRMREARFLQNETPSPPVPAGPPAEPAPQGYQHPQEHLNYRPAPSEDNIPEADMGDGGGGGGDLGKGVAEIPPEAGFVFPFYGTDYDEFFISTEGFLALGQAADVDEVLPANPDGSPNTDQGAFIGSFQEGPARVAPLWTDFTAEPADASISVDATDDHYRVTWDNIRFIDNPERASFAATLYKNGVIAFSYGDVGLVNNHPFTTAPLPPFMPNPPDGFYTLVGLSPGAGVGRTWTSVDFSGTDGSYDYVDLEGIYEWWLNPDGSGDGHTFDLANSYLIFTPGSPKYAPAAGTRDMFVDIATVDQAVESTLVDGDLLALVNAGDYKPGALDIEGYTNGFAGSWSGYRHGLQTVGQDSQGHSRVYTHAATMEGINQSGFMAYAVQVEEDRVNREILAMHRERLKGHLRRQVDHALEYGDIRVRDDWLTQKADAQAGRVLKDRSGHWVRVQQYVLRPDEQTVQVLNVSLRDGSGDLEGISTIDWQTSFKESVDGVNLKTLPWNQWLDTQENEAGRFVTTTAGAPELGEMSVAFTNPAEESLKEARWFAAKSLMDSAPVQAIRQEQLTLVSRGLDNTLDYAWGCAPLMDGQYRVVKDPAGSSSHPGGFHYALRTGGSERSVNVAFFVVGDGDRADNQGLASGDYSGVAFKDIWDALRVNEPGGPQIGENILEIAIDADKQVFSQPVDVVYIPMSRMLWK